MMNDDRHRDGERPAGTTMTVPRAMSEFEPLSLYINDTAKSLAISRSQVYVLLRHGTLTARKDGSRTVVDYASVKAHHERRAKFVPGVPIPNAPKARRKAKGARS